MTRASRRRQRQAVHVARARADWQIRLVVPFGASGVSVTLPLPIFRRLRYDPALVDRIGRGVEEYLAVNRLGGQS